MSTQKRIATRFAIIALLLLCAIATILFFAAARQDRTVSAETTTTYATTDKLYLTVPNVYKNMTFKTIGGEVNGGVHSADVSSGTDTLPDMRNWFELSIRRDDGGKWNVRAADAAGGKWYFDASKHALKGSVSLYLNIKSEMPKDKLYTFLCNGDELWQRRKNPYLSHPCDDGCSLPVVKVTSDRGVYYESNPFTDGKELKTESPYPIGAGNGWKTSSSNTCDGTLGINPVIKSVKLASVSANSGTCTISFDYWVGAYVTPSALSAGPGQNANRAKAQHETFGVSFSTSRDVSAPVLSAESTVSDNAVAATWTDATYTFATHTRNGESLGEYTAGAELTDEGKYIITATDCVGNSSSITLVVDKTAPKFSSEFYDAAGKPLVKYTKENSYVLPFPTASAYESDINTRATYVRSYYDNAAGRVVKEPAAYYNKGGKLTLEGKYDITVSDAAGNSSTCTVLIDRSPPVLSGAEYSNSSITASYSYSSTEAPITSKYTLTTASGTSSAQSYGSGMRLTTEGKYVITAADAAGNTTSKTLYVDKTAPVLVRSFEYGKTAGNATFSRSAWESPVTATYSFVGPSGTGSGPYSSGQSLKADGEYTITAIDGAGNKTSVKIVVDSRAPTLTFGDGTTGAAQITRSSSFVKWSVEKYEAPVTVTYSFMSENKAVAPDIEAAPYSSGSAINAEGTYSFTAIDAAGNTSKASVIIDRTPPRLTFAANGARFERYVNTAFTASSTDALSGVDKLELYEGGKYVPYDFAPRFENGEYLFRVTDKAGNVTSATATVFATATFGNLAEIYDGYKLNEWYIVTLPARIFTTESKDAAGRYSFSSYEKALAFAEAKEREFRVTAVQGGYMYVSASNETVAQKYDTEASLNAVVEKYAKGYISARQTASAGGSDKYFTEPESLTRNAPILPDYLLDLKNLPHYYARPDTAWGLPNLSYISAMPYTVTARYLGDFTEDKTQKEFLIPDGATLLSAAAEYKQGWYLITERDAAGNSEKYLIYSDAALPTVRAAATFGDGSEDVIIDYAYTQNETLYFISLELSALLDNADPYVTLKIEKGSTVKYFTQADALPTLGADDYTGGKYTLSVYDRSHNTLVFDVYIAGAAPTWSHGSLAADKPECKLSFVTSDRYNVITGITLYKIEYDGSKTVLETDGNGTAISAATLSYVLSVGGKYGATVTDNYRRTVELSPVFYMKGLPSGKLSGVSDGGRTNKNVSFTFDAADVCELFVLLPGGDRKPFTDYSVQTGAEQTTYNITADEPTSHEYLVFLHNAQDLSLFVEYTFEIDTILPEFEITDSDGNVIPPDGATNKAFSIKWQETGVNVRYYTARSGSLGASKYTMNAVLSQGTLYYFTLKDEVGNTLEFTVLLDNAVDYTIGGKYNTVDGVLYANGPITFTVNEPTQAFEIENADGFTIENGGTLTQAGRYDVTVTDNYRNTVKLVLVLDFTPPTLALDGAQPGEAVKNDVKISADDYDYLYSADRLGNKIKDVADGEVFKQAGTYFITASDYAGNSVTVTFSIDLSVDYTLSVPNGAVTTDSVVLDSAEALTVEVKLDGEVVESATRFSAPGEYELTLTDGIGNIISCVFVILPARARSYSRSLPLGTRITSILKNGVPLEVSDATALALEETGSYSVTLDCGGVPLTIELTADNTSPAVTIEKDGKNVVISAVDKENVTLMLTKDGVEMSCHIGQTFDEPGHYVLTVTDDLGNIATYEFDIKYRLNTWAIVAIAVGAVALIVVLILIIRARRKPRMK